MCRQWASKLLRLYVFLVLVGGGWHGLRAEFSFTSPAWAATDGKVPETKVPKAVFLDTRYQFEPVIEGAQVKHDFFIENHGTAPLIIEKVQPG